MEISLQFGCYKPFLKRSSYAALVNTVTDHALIQKNKPEPQILIIGTSLAYEGISMRILNERLSPLKMRAESIAIPGAELIIQRLALEKILNKYKNIKYIIQLNEIQMAWVRNETMPHATLAMVSEFDRLKAIKLLREQSYELGIDDLSYIFIKFISYRNDIGEFILNPAGRIKDIGKKRKEFENEYLYENKYEESLTLYPFKDIKECLKVTAPNSAISTGSNKRHQEAIFKTCILANDTNLPFEETEATRLYHKKLSNLYQLAKDNNIKIINVFPPLPVYLNAWGYQRRIQFWKEHYHDLLGEIVDYSNLVPEEDNSSYYYDILHLNRKGMEFFTEKLSTKLMQIMAEPKEVK